MNASVVGLSEDFFLDYGAFNVTTNLARLLCRLEYAILEECVNDLCSNFAEVCPSNNGGNQIEQGAVNCESIGATICDTFHSVDGCCMSSCALELQDLVLCVGGLKLTCPEPDCNSSETIPDMSCTLQEDNNFLCIHNSTIATNGTVLKTVESTLYCTSYNETEFDIYASDCQCDAAFLIGNTSTQVCDCNLCQQWETEFISLDCSMSIDDPFVVDNCLEQTCGGECIAREVDPSTTPTEMPTQEQTTRPSPGPSETQSNVLTTQPSVIALINETEYPIEMTESPTLLSTTPAPTPLEYTPIPTAFTSNSLPPSGPLLQDTMSPSDSATLGAPTIDNVTTNLPTTWGNVTDRPIRNSTPAPTLGMETMAPEAQASKKWYTNQSVLTFGGAFLCTCFLLCMMVSIKGDSRRTAGQPKKEEDGNALNMFM